MGKVPVALLSYYYLLDKVNSYGSTGGEGDFFSFSGPGGKQQHTSMEALRWGLAGHGCPLCGSMKSRAHWIADWDA